MGTPETVSRGCDIRVITAPSVWMEDEAIRQLQSVSRFPGMTACVGMPDLHPGKGTPIGAAFLCRDRLYPHLVGNDIGCGMALWMTDLPLHKLRSDRLAERLDGLDHPMDETGAAQRERLAESGLEQTMADLALGTPGRGNHFLELQKVVEVADPIAFAAMGLEDDRLFALVHTGSRGMGEAVLRRHVERYGAEGLQAGSPEAADYLARHDAALRYAQLNRQVCAERLFAAIRAQGQPVLSLCHNHVIRLDRAGVTGWLHRKGAAPSDVPLAIVPGSRGDASYLVIPDPQRADGLFSLAHGAGRRIARQDARQKLEGLYRQADLTRPALGGRVICGDRTLLWEEAPECYKGAGPVVQAMVEAGLCRVLAVLMPVITFKTSNQQGRADIRRHDRDQRRERRLARAAKEGGR